MFHRLDSRTLLSASLVTMFMDHGTPSFQLDQPGLRCAIELSTVPGGKQDNAPTYARVFVHEMGGRNLKNGVTFDVAPEDVAQGLVFRGTAGNDHMEITSTPGFQATFSDVFVGLYGYEGNDRLQARSRVSVISGMAGNDKLYGSSEGDVIFDGQGNDYVSGGDGPDTLYSEDGSDTLYGGNGNDTVLAQFLEGYDILCGNAGDNDQLIVSLYNANDTHLYAKALGFELVNTVDEVYG